MKNIPLGGKKEYVIDIDLLYFVWIINSQISYMLISTIDRVDDGGAAQQHEQPEDGEHGLGEAEAGTDLGLGAGSYILYYICWHPGGEMMIRPGLG